MVEKQKTDSRKVFRNRSKCLIAVEEGRLSQRKAQQKLVWREIDGKAVTNVHVHVC